jgi:hypothetical protein
VGDFDCDGHWDVVAATRGGDKLYLLEGDGRGGLRLTGEIRLPGAVTALTVGEINRPDGLEDVVVGIETNAGAQVLVYEGTEGALRSQPEIFNFAATVTALALGQLDDEYAVDLAVASGSDLALVHGRDRRLSLDELSQSKVEPAKLSRHSLPFAIKSIAIGDFDADRGEDIAVLAEGGGVFMINPRNEGFGRERELATRIAAASWPQATALIRARVSGLSSDDLIVVDSPRRRLSVIIGVERGDQTVSDDSLREIVLLDAEGEPVAVAPMRLNSDALSDLVIGVSGRRYISVVTTTPAAIFTVTNANPGGPGSLEQAIIVANNSLGADMIVFNIGLSRPTLKGLVHDEKGQGLADSSVVVRSQRWGITRVVSTDQDGGYGIPDLPTGDYLIDATWSSRRAESLPILFDRKEVWAPIITIAASINTNGNGQAAPGQSPTGPSGSQAGGRQASGGEKAGLLINIVDVMRSANFGERQIGSLPLGAAGYMRSFDELALLTPGVAPPPYTPGARGPGVGFGIGTAGQFSVNGMRARSNNFSVDGSDNNDADVGVRRQGFVALVPQSIESVNGLSVVTLLWDAELGRNAGGQINAVSKYGANQFHGQAYGFFNDSRLNARNFFDYTGGVAGGKDPFTRTQVGGVIGGPFIKDRTHFFASFERVKVNASIEQHFATPTDSERRFIDLSKLDPAFTNVSEFGVLNSGAIQSSKDMKTPLGTNILSLICCLINQAARSGRIRSPKSCPLMVTAW